MKDNLISVPMVYLSPPYDIANYVTCHIADFLIAFPWRLQVMTHILLRSVREKVDHCRVVSFSVVLL